MDLTQMLRGGLPSAGELRYGFEVAGLKLLPAAGVLTEMVAEARVFPVPKAAPNLAGVINLRGTIVPLLDRRAVPREAGHIRPFVCRALVLDRDDHRVGLLIDNMPQLLALMPLASASPRPADVFETGGPHDHRPGLKDFLSRPWCRVDQPDEIWWEFNHRLAFEALARSAGSASNHPHATPSAVTHMSSPQDIEEVIE
jgi:purine-binding chemotaxis protein CheW